LRADTPGGAQPAGCGDGLDRLPAARREPQVVRALLERGDDEAHVLVEVDAELLRAAAHVVAVDRGREARLLELLLDRLGRHAADALGAHHRTRHDEARELVDGVQRVLERALARHVEVVGVRGDGPDELWRLAAALELGHRQPRVARLRVGMALVVHVVQQAHDAPQLLVLAGAPGGGAHGRLDGQAVAAQGGRFDPLGEQVPGLVARKGLGHGC
jgi:hypothetical protein